MARKRVKASLTIRVSLTPGDAMTVTPRETLIALEESLKLQSHYAELLNMHDGGARIGFADAEAWIARLRETGRLPAVSRGTSQTSGRSQT